MTSRRKFIGLALSLLAGCKPDNDSIRHPRVIQQSMSMTDITVRLGEKSKDFIASNPGLVKIEKQPAGLNFYSIVWPTEKRGKVLVDHGKNSLRILHALTLLSSEEDKDADAAGGFQNVDIGAGISSGGPVLHDDARLIFYGLIKEANASGWRSIWHESDPRIFGKQRLDYALDRDMTIGLDERYTPSLDEWLRIENMTEWRMYADRIFLSVSFQRHHGQAGQSKYGTYLITFNLKTEAEYFKGLVDVKNRNRWRENLNETLVGLAQDREKIEKELAMKGFDIDKSYKNPASPT